MKRTLLFIAGFLSLVLGILGILLPILPTTPFLLLAATCFLRSSDKLYHWLLNHRIFGSYIKSYIQYKAITMKSKLISVIILWLFILFSVIVVVPIIWVKILLLLIAISVTIHILKIRTLTYEMIQEMVAEENQ